MTIKIYKPSKTAMQSGRSKYNKWVLKFSDQKNQLKDTMMGWNGGSSTVSQIELKFSSKEEAVSYAKKNSIDLIYFVEDDYIHEKNSISEMLFAYEKISSLIN